jgi:hypothetical protein
MKSRELVTRILDRECLRGTMQKSDRVLIYISLESSKDQMVDATPCLHPLTGGHMNSSPMGRHILDLGRHLHLGLDSLDITRCWAMFMSWNENNYWNIGVLPEKHSTWAVHLNFLRHAQFPVVWCRASDRHSMNFQISQKPIIVSGGKRMCRLPRDCTESSVPMIVDNARELKKSDRSSPLAPKFVPTNNAIVGSFPGPAGLRETSYHTWRLMT